MADAPPCVVVVRRLSVPVQAGGNAPRSLKHAVQPPLSASRGPKCTQRVFARSAPRGEVAGLPHRCRSPHGLQSDCGVPPDSLRMLRPRFWLLLGFCCPGLAAVLRRAHQLILPAGSGNVSECQVIVSATTRVLHCKDVSRSTARRRYPRVWPVSVTPPRRRYRPVTPGCPAPPAPPRLLRHACSAVPRHAPLPW